MPQIVQRRRHHVPKAFDKSHKNKKGGHYPAHQTIATTSLPELSKIPIQSSSFTSTAFTNGSTIFFDIEPHEFKQAENLELKLELSASGGDVTIVPGFYLFSEIELIADKGSGDKVGDFIHSETLLSWNLMTMKDEELKNNQQYQNYSITSYKNSYKYKLGQNSANIIRDGDTRHIYVKIPFNFVHFKAIDMSHISTPFRIRLKCSSDVVVSGSSSNLSLDNIQVVVLGRREESFDDEHRRALHKNDNKYIFLQSERLTYNNKTITAGSETKFDLQTIVGKCPYLVFCIKPSTSPVASDESLYDFVELGPNGSVDLVNSAGQSEIAASNNDWDITYLEKCFVEMTGSHNIQGLYILPFCEDIHKSVAGQMNGWFQFYGQRCDLVLTPDSAGTAEVHAVDLGVTAPDDGQYAFQVNGEVSDYLAYNATTATMKSTLEAMTEISSRGYTVTCSAAATNGSFNITFDQNRDGRVSDELGVIKVISNNLNDGGVEAAPSTSVSTYGKKGFASGSNYQVEIFAMKFVELCIDKNGKISCRDL